MGLPFGFEIPFVCVFIMFLLYFVALIPVRRAQALQLEGFDNSNPREQYNRLVNIMIFSKVLKGNNYIKFLFDTSTA